MSYEDELVARIRGNEDLFWSCGGVMKKVRDKKDFIHSVISEDNADDWILTRQLGECLVLHLGPGYLVGHFILCRACRHLGDVPRATEALARCREVIASRTSPRMEMEVLVPLVERESQLLTLP
jgi:hypothetical protein